MSVVQVSSISFRSVITQKYRLRNMEQGERNNKKMGQLLKLGTKFFDVENEMLKYIIKVTT